MLHISSNQMVLIYFFWSTFDIRNLWNECWAKRVRVLEYTNKVSNYESCDKNYFRPEPTWVSRPAFGDWTEIADKLAARAQKSPTK